MVYFEMTVEARAAFFPRGRLVQLLSEIVAGHGDFITLYLGASSVRRLDSETPLEDAPSIPGRVVAALATRKVREEVGRYGTGVVVFWSESGRRLIVVPPYPIVEEGVYLGRPEVGALCQLLTIERLIGVILVTWGSYAVGVFKSDQLIESRTGTGYIHKRHRKGGRSERRFARRTEEQKKHFLRKVANRADETFGRQRPLHIFFGGNRLILKPLISESAYLRSDTQRISKRIISVRSADGAALRECLERVNGAVVFDLSEGGSGTSQKATDGSHPPPDGVIL